MTLHVSLWCAETTDGLLPGAFIGCRSDDEAKTLQYFAAEPSHRRTPEGPWIVHELLKRDRGKEVGEFATLDAIEAWLCGTLDQKVLPSAKNHTGKLSARLNQSQTFKLIEHHEQSGISSFT